MPKQMKTNRSTPVGPTRAKASDTYFFTKSLGRSRHRVWGPIRRRATKEGSKVINRDWVNYHACKQCRSSSVGFWRFVFVLRFYGQVKHVERDQFTQLHVYWAGLVLLAVNQYCAYSFARISGRERMIVDNISWSSSTKESCRPR